MVDLGESRGYRLVHVCQQALVNKQLFVISSKRNMGLDAVMDWEKVVESASEPNLLRFELNATLRLADEARMAGRRSESVKFIEEAWALSDRLAVANSRDQSGRLLDSEEAPA